MKFFRVILVFVAIFLITPLAINGCGKENRDLRLAIEEADTNADNIKAVLSYCKQSGDEEKYHAAIYLITNMCGHWSYDSVPFQSCCAELRNLLQSSSITPVVSRKVDRLTAYIRDSIEKYPDLQILDSSYLCSNIDKAFLTWKTSPYCKDLDFKDFCRYILPYKIIDGQPCDEWREYVDTERKRPPYSFFQIEDNITNPIAAAFAFDVSLMTSMPAKQYPYASLQLPEVFDYHALQAISFTTCPHQTFLSIVNNISGGVPVAWDYTPAYSDRNDSHHWATLVSSSRNDYAYEPFSEDYYSGSNRACHYPKVYRKSFEINKFLKKAADDGVTIPHTIDLFSKDVTELYCKTADIDISLKTRPHNGWVYLAVSNGMSWVPVALGKARRRYATFKKVGIGGVFLVFGLDSYGNPIPLTNPFLLQGNGILREFSVDTLDRKRVHLTRRYPAFSHIWRIKDNLSSADIRASNDYKFRKCDFIARIPGDTLLSGELQNTRKDAYRYIELRASTSQPSCIAELYFHTGDSIIHPKIVDEGVYSSDSLLCYNSYTILDNDPLSYFCLKEPYHYVKYDFLKPVQIERISYIKRGDGNDIVPGDNYALYFWNNNEWELSSQRMANSTVLAFDNVPMNTLYILKDLSSGRQCRIFSIENNSVCWH